MNNKVINIALDLGGSEIRVKSSLHEAVTTYDNSVKKANASSVRDYSDDLYEEFKILEAPSIGMENCDFYVKGSAMMSYNGEYLSPNNQQLKTEQKVTTINLIYSIAREVLEAKNARVNLGICIPAVEKYQGAGDLFKEQLCGKYKVLFPKLNETVEFTLEADDIHLIGEGIAAFMYEPSLNKALLRKWSRQNILVIDAGYRSTELILIVNLKPAFYTAVSPAKGGINIEGEIYRLLTSKGINDPDVKKAITAGYIIRNTDIINVGKIVQLGKKIFADSLRDDIISMVTATREVKNIGNINGIFTTGRCFEKQGKDETDTGCLIKYIQQSLGSEAEEYRSVSFGTANILGTYLFLQNKYS